MNYFINRYNVVQNFVVQRSTESSLSKILVVLLMWAVLFTPVWITLLVGSLLGATSGLAAVGMLAIFLYFLGAIQLFLVAVGFFITVAVFLS